MDGVLVEPNLFASIASCLCPHRVASLEQVSPALKVSSEACGVWSRSGSMSLQVQHALGKIIEELGDEDAVDGVDSVLGLLPRGRGVLLCDALFNLCYVLSSTSATYGGVLREGSKCSYNGHSLIPGGVETKPLEFLKKLRKNAGEEGLQSLVREVIKSGNVEDVALVADGAFATLHAMLKAILATAGCKAVFKALNHVLDGHMYPLQQLSPGRSQFAGYMALAEIEVWLGIRIVLCGLRERPDRPLVDFRKHQRLSSEEASVSSEEASVSSEEASVSSLASGDAVADEVEVAVADEEPSLAEQHGIPRDGSGDVGDFAGAQKDIAAKVRFLVIELNKSSKRIDDVLLGSELAVNAAEQGGELQPEWANGAKVFQTGVMPEHVAHVALSNRFVIIPIEKEETLNLLMFQLSSNERPRKKKRVDDAARVPYADARDDLSVPYADARDDIIYFVNRTFVEVLVPGEEYATASSTFRRSVSAPSLS